MGLIDREIETEVVVEKKGGFFGKLLSFVLSIVVGAVGCVGGVGYAGYYAATQMKIQEGFDYVNSLTDAGIDYTQYINGKYGEATVMELFGDVGLALQEIAAGNGSLNTLNDISPYISLLIKGDENTPEEDGVINILKAYGIELDGDEFMKRLLAKPMDVTESKPDVYLTDYILEEVNEMPLGDLLMGMGMMLDPMMMLILYGVEGEDYEVVDGRPQMLGDAQPVTLGNIVSLDIMEKVNDIPLAFLLHPSTSDTMMMALCFGSDNRYSINEGQAVMGQMYFLKNDQGQMLDDQGNLIENQTVTDIDATAYTRTLKITNGETVTTYYLKSNDEGKTFLAYSDAELQKPVKFSVTTFGNLKEQGSGFINNLALKDVLKVTEDTKDAFKKALCFEEVDGVLVPRTIGQLVENSEFINDLKLKDVLNVTDSSPDFIKALCKNGDEDTTIGDLTTNKDLINTLALKDVLGVDLEDEDTSPFMKALCSKTVVEEGVSKKVDTTIADLQSQDFIDGLSLKDILGVDLTDPNTSSFMKALCSKTVDGETQDTTFKDLQSKDFINGLTLKDILGVTDSSPSFMQALCTKTVVDGDTVTEVDTTISDLQSEDFINSLALSDVLGVVKDDPDSNDLLQAICFDEEGNSRTIKALQEPDFIDDIPLSDILHVNHDNSLVMYLIYGKEGIHYKEDPVTKEIKMLQKRVGIYETDGHVYDEYGDTPIANTYNAGTHTFTLKDAESNDVTYQLVDGVIETKTIKRHIESTDPKQYEEIEIKFYYVQELVDGEYKDAYFEAPTFGMLAAENSPLLENAMHHLTVADILPAEDIENNKLLSLMSHAPIMDMSKEVETLKIVDIFEKDIYYTNADGEFTDAEGNVLADGEKVMQPTWKYLLTDENGDIDTDLTIQTGMSSMMTNMTREIQKATIKQLVDDGILTLSEDAQDKYDQNPNHPVFQYTITGLLDYMFTIIPSS